MLIRYFNKYVGTRNTNMQNAFIIMSLVKNCNKYILYYCCMTEYTTHADITSSTTVC